MDGTTTAAAPAPTTDTPTATTASTTTASAPTADTLSAAVPAAAVEKSPHDLLMESASTYTTEDGQTVKYLPTSLDPSQLGHEIDRIDLVVGELDKDISFHEENAKDAAGNFLVGDALTAKRDELIGAKKDELRVAEVSGITAEEREALQGKIAKEEALIARKMDPAQYEEAKLHRENAELKMAGLAYALDKQDNYKYLEESSERWEKKSVEFDKTIAGGAKILRTTTDQKPPHRETDNHYYLTYRYNSNPQEQAAKVKRVLSGSQVVGAVDTIIGDDSVISNFENKAIVKDTKLPTREDVGRYASNTHGSYYVQTDYATGGLLYNDGPVNPLAATDATIVKYYPIDPREQYFGLHKDADGDLSYKYTNREGGNVVTSSPVAIAKGQTPLPKSVREALSEREAAAQAARDGAELDRQFEASGRVNRTSESSEASQRSATTSVASTNAERQGSQASSEERELDAQFKVAGRDKSGGPVSSSAGPSGVRESLPQEASSRELAQYPTEPQLLTSSQLEPSQPAPREQNYGGRQDEGALIAMLRALVTLLTLGMVRDQKYTSSRHNPEVSLDSSRSVSQQQAGQQEAVVRREVQPRANMPRAQDEAIEVLRRRQGQQETSTEVGPAPAREGSDRESPAAEIAVPGQGEALPGLDSGLVEESVVPDAVVPDVAVPEPAIDPEEAVPEPVIDPEEAAMREAEEMAREIGRQMAFANEENLPEATNASLPDAEHETESASKKDPANTHVEKVEEDRERAQLLEDDDTLSRGGESRA